MFQLNPVIETKWNDFRAHLSRFLVYLARKINPKCPYEYTYFMEQLLLKQYSDQSIFGSSCMKFEWDDKAMTRKHVPMDELIAGVSINESR